MAYRYQGDAALVAQDAGTCALQMGFESVFWRALKRRGKATGGTTCQEKPGLPQWRRYFCVSPLWLSPVLEVPRSPRRNPRPQQKWRNLSLFIGYHGILQNLIVTMHKFTHLS